MNSFERRTAEEVRRRRLFKTGDFVVCAVSGGPDSTALARVLVAAAKETRVSKLALAHFDHRIRPESAQDAEWVRAFARELGVEYLEGSADVPALKTAFRRSPEEAAREARRDFLLRVRAKTGAHAVALAHQVNDQAETVFMRLIRGAGVRGLGGIRWKDENGFVRPLLWATKNEITAYLAELGQTYLEDPTNLDLSYPRNLVRRVILPALEKKVPDVSRRLAELAGILARADEVMENRVQKATENYMETTARSAELKDEFRNELAPAAARRLIQYAYGAASGERANLERAHVERLLAMEEGSSVNLPAGLVAERRNGVTSFRMTELPRIESWAALVRVPGETVVPVPGFRVSAGPATNSRGADYSVTLDAETVAGEVLVRARRPGDRLRPAGFGHTRKLQDVFVDAKVPRAERDLYPLIFNGETLLAVPGIAVAEGAAPEPDRPAITLALTRLRREINRVSS